MRRLPAALLLLLAVSMVFSVSCFESESSDGQTVQESYPDADVVIVQGDRGNVSLIYRTEPVEGSGEPTYQTRSVRSGGDVRLFDITGGLTDIKIVMLSGKIGTLSMLNVDAYHPDSRVSSMSFVMNGGEVERLQAVSVANGVVYHLPDSYFSAYYAVDEIFMSISGKVGEISPSSALIGIGSISIRVSDGATVDRLYPTGSNGRYDDVSVTMTGGHIGYMTNQRSVMSSLVYDLRKGEIDYLCLGADVEGGSGYYSTNLWTSYVMRDVDIGIGEYMSIGRAILGAGITDVPRILSNGQTPATVSARNVMIESYSEIYVDRSFVEGDKVLRFTSYSIGDKPSSGSPRSTYYVAYKVHELYGEDGIWDSYSGASIQPGVKVVVSAPLFVQSMSSLEITRGAIMVNADHIVVSGTISCEGTLRNDSVIEKRGSGSIEGKISGSGCVSYGIVALTSKEGRIDVMAESDDAVTIRSDSGELYFNKTSVYLKDIGCRVVVSAPSSMYIGGESFTIGLTKVDVSGFSHSWMLYLSGFDSESPLTYEITVPLRIADGYVAEIVGPDGEVADILGTSDSDVTFLAVGSGIYSFRAMEMDEGDEGLLSGMTLNIVVASAIVVVASLVVYFLLRRD